MMYCSFSKWKFGKKPQISKYKQSGEIRYFYFGYNEENSNLNMLDGEQSREQFDKTEEERRMSQW